MLGGDELSVNNEEDRHEMPKLRIISSSIHIYRHSVRSCRENVEFFGDPRPESIGTTDKCK